MLYEYHCSGCGATFDMPFRMGTAESFVKCQCGYKASRSFSGASFILKGGGWPSKAMKFNEEQTRKNEEAGERMKGQRPPVRRIATDYGNGKIEEYVSPK